MREAAFTWERERDAANALARQITEAEQLLGVPASPNARTTSSGSAGPRMSHTAVLWHDPTDSFVAQLHYQAGGVQNIRLLDPIVLKPEFPSYARLASTTSSATLRVHAGPSWRSRTSSWATPRPGLCGSTRVSVPSSRATSLSASSATR